MRLTLRTMLAYLDDILEPADAQEITQKIDQSEFATNLMHRIRDVTRRLRLAAPRLEGRGMGLDPNTVAEYLDNTLPGERVPDFEKVCLESDVHLAEVAAAHQILALVLGEPAEIPAALRERIYQVASQSAASPENVTAPPTPAAAVSAPPMAQAPASPSAAANDLSPAAQRQKPEVPEYLREPPRSRGGSGWLAAAVLILLLLGAGFFALQQRDRIRGWLNPEAEVAEAPKSDEPLSPTQPGPSATVDTVNSATAPGDTTMPQTAGTTPVDAAVNNASPAVPPGAPAMTTPMPTEAESSPTIANLAAPTVTPPVASAPAATPAAAAATPPALTQPSATAAAGAPAMTVPAGASAPPSAPEAPAAPMPPVVASTVGSRPTTTPPAATLESPEGVGRFISEHQVLLHLDRQAQAWHRLAPRSVVFPGDQITCLPAFRCDLAFSAGVNAQLRGAAAVEILPADAEGVPGLKVKRGRVMLLTVGRPNSKLRLWAGPRQGTLIFGDGDSACAVEARPTMADGSDPEKADSPVQVDLYVTSGAILWSDGVTPEPESLQAPAVRALASAAPVAPRQLGAPVEMPLWVTGDERSELDRKAAPILDESLAASRPITLGLKELAGDRRVEVSSLATRSLIMVHEYDAALAMLNDTAQKANWNDLIDSLRAAAAESKTSASAIRASWERNRVGKAADLYRLLWGYTPEQLNAGDAQRLVDWLDNEELDYRVLSFWNLYRITGNSLFYRPEYVGAKRQQFVVKWRQKLETGQLVPKAMP